MEQIYLFLQNTKNYDRQNYNLENLQNFEIINFLCTYYNNLIQLPQSTKILYKFQILSLKIVINFLIDDNIC